MNIDIEEFCQLLEGLNEYQLKNINDVNHNIYYNDSLIHRVKCLRNIKRMSEIESQEFLAVQFSNYSIHGQEYNYNLYSINRYPDLKIFLGYWGCALPRFGIVPFNAKFVIYSNGNNIRLDNKNSLKTHIKTQNGYVNPSKIVTGVVLPYKYLQVPIFSFIK